MNWAATARKANATPLVNTYYDEKDGTVMLLVDASASMNFGSRRLSKKTLAAEICASLVYSALCAHDRVGFMGFAADLTDYLPPRHAWKYQRLIPERILDSKPASSVVDFAVAVARIERWVKHPSLVFLLSDFLVENLAGLRHALRRLQRRHEIIVLRLTDPLEMSVPTGYARLTTRDLETGRTVALSFTPKNQHAIENRMRLRQMELRELFQSLHLQHLTVTATTNYAEELTQLFLSSHRRASA